MSSAPVPSKQTRRPRHHLAQEPPRPVVIARPAARRLPTPLTSLVGRDGEVAAVCTLLVDDGVRLLTLTGPGGVGKTRLALQIAEGAAAAFADNVVFVPLAAITDPELVLPAIAREIGLRETAAQSVAELLASHLRHRRFLLVLDNVEHVVRAAPQMAALLGSCSGLTVLATSRARLHVSGEYRFPVSPLELPDPTRAAGDLPFAAIASSPAVQLFVERARAVEPHFVFDGKTAPAIAAICHRLDGLPLAIELAAAHTRILSPAELIVHLEPALPLLSGGPSDAPDRLRTMRNAIAWSYDLLTQAEQTLLQRLSAFAGGCTLEAAEYVGGKGERGEEGPSVLASIAALVDASLVQRYDVGGETRLTMLETIREFALERLAVSGQMEEIAARHAAWCVGLAETVRRSGGLSRHEGLARLESEHPNMRAALTSLLARGEVTAALYLAGELAEFWLRRGHLAEGVAWLERALARDDGGPTGARANALVGLNMLLWPHAARTEGQTDANPAGGESGDFARPVQLLAEAEAVARAADDAGALAYARLHQGYVACFRGDLDLAEARGAESTMTAAAIPQGFSLNGAYWLLAEVALAREDDARAGEHFTRLLELARAGGDEISRANALAGLALLAERRGDPGAALRGFAAAAAVCREYGNRLHAGLCLEQAATTAAAIGHSAAAVRLTAAADALSVVEGMGPVRLNDPRHHRHELVLATVRTAVGEASFTTLWRAGAALSLDEAIAEIHSLAARLSGEPPADRKGQSALLTAREHDVLRLLADGLSDKAIGATLGISRRTASQHVAAILSKLEAASRTAAVTSALREGLLEQSVSDRA